MSDWSLEIGGKQPIFNPSPEQIETAIRSITLSDDPFLILQKGADSLTYIQAMLEDNSSWVVEYQEGDLKHHFQASNLSTEKVTAMFVAYAGGDEVWRSSAKWERIEV